MSENIPFTPFLVNISPPPPLPSFPPQDVNINAPFTGLELTVSGLRHDTTYSASQHLRQLLHDLASQNPSIPEFNIVSPASSRPLDYVAVSLAGSVRETPRPDILESIRVLLDASPGITAHWKIASSNIDKSRLLTFSANARLLAPQLKSRLESIFQARGYGVQACFNTTNPERLSFLFYNRDHVRCLLDQPPLIDGRTYFPTAPRYIEPHFGLEVAVNGVADIQGAKAYIDRHLERRYGGTPQDPVVRQSRLVMNGSVYCCILRTPAITSHFLRSPWTLFEEQGMGFNVPKPTYLYILNSQGIPKVSIFGPPSSVASSSRPDPDTQRQLDSLRNELSTVMHKFEYIGEQYQVLISAFQKAQVDMCEMVTEAVSGFSLQHMLTTIQSEIDAIRSARMLCKFLLANAAPHAKSDIVKQIESIDQTIQEAVARRDQIEQSIRFRRPANLVTSIASRLPTPTNQPGPGALPLEPTVPLQDPGTAGHSDQENR